MLHNDVSNYVILKKNGDTILEYVFKRSVCMNSQM